MRATTRILAAAAVAAAGLAGGVATAQAVSVSDVPGDYVGTRINIRAEPNGPVIGQGNRGDGVTAICMSAPGGKYWVWHRNNRTGQFGWSSKALVQTPYFPQMCQ